MKATQSELIEVLRFANLAKSADGAYHQFLYQMGYTPKGEFASAVGTNAGTNPCCNEYPNLGTNPCAKGSQSANSYTLNNSGESCGAGFSCRNGCNLGVCQSPPCTCQGSATAWAQFTYYNCKNDALNKALTNIQICNAAGYKKTSTNPKGIKCSVPSGLAFPSSFTKCTPNPSSWCTCKKFVAGAKSNSFDEEITLDHNGMLCAQK